MKRKGPDALKKEKKKSICDWTRKELEKLPHREGWNKEIECDSLIILPTKKKHDSGYLCMDFVAVKDNKPLCLVSGCSDVIHLDGIGGYGYRWTSDGVYPKVPNTIPVSGWSIDCLPNGLLRLWPHSKKVIVGAALSSFEVWAKGK